MTENNTEINNHPKANETLLDFTSALSEYAKQIIAYVGFNSDEKPWPIGKWLSK